MIKEFESNITKSGLFSKKQKLLLAISGGIDSVVLAHLLKKGGYQFALAHCNFKLRGKESDADEKFCLELAKKLSVKLYRTEFNTQDYCEEHKTNVQLAARKLRYDWFYELLKEHSFHYLLTAHHANDVVETFFINLLRGTGIKGLKGIPEKNGKVIRPLLNLKREELEAYAKKENIIYRTDKSNFEERYERNFIRLSVIPTLKTIQPALEDVFLKNIKHLKQEADIVTDFLELKAAEIVTQTHDFVFINKKKLKQEKYAESILHHLIGGYGFNETQENNILKNIQTNALTGKIFHSATHHLSIDRDDLVIKTVSSPAPVTEIFDSLKDLKKHPSFKLTELKKFAIPKPNELLIRSEKLIFPLYLRNKKTGDKFKPFGMKGFKLLSDFLKDKKLHSFEKEKCRILQNGNGEIIWVIGFRSDERYKVTSKDSPILKLTFID